MKTYKVLRNILYQSQRPVTFKRAVKRAVAFSIFLSIFLFVFRPFGLHVYELDRSYVFLGYGVVTLGTLILNDFAFQYFLKKYFARNKFKVVHQLQWYLWQFLCLGVTNFLFAVYLNAFPLNIVSFLKIQLFVILCAFIPIVIYILIEQNYLLKRNLQEAKEIDKELERANFKNGSDNHPIAENEKPLLFHSENSKESIGIIPNRLLYLISQDNYVAFVWEDGLNIKKRLIRNTLQHYESQLKEDKRFYRCHRSYMVNLTKITAVSGNSQGYLLSVDGIADAIPVSRAKGGALKSALTRLQLHNLL